MKSAILNLKSAMLILAVAVIAVVNLTGCSTTSADKVSSTIESALPAITTGSTAAVGTALALTNDNAKVIAGLQSVASVIRTVEGVVKPGESLIQTIVADAQASGIPQVVDAANQISAELTKVAPQIKTVNDSIAAGEAAASVIDSLTTGVPSPTPAGN